MKIIYYDCPTFMNADAVRGKKLDHYNDEYTNMFKPMFLCDFVRIKGYTRAIFKKVFNMDEHCYEIWIKGEV